MWAGLAGNGCSSKQQAVPSTPSSFCIGHAQFYRLPGLCLAKPDRTAKLIYWPSRIRQIAAVCIIMSAHRHSQHTHTPSWTAYKMFIQTASWLATLAARKVGETVREREEEGCELGLQLLLKPLPKLESSWLEAVRISWTGGVNLFTCHAFWATISTHKVARGGRQSRESYRKPERGLRRSRGRLAKQTIICVQQNRTSQVQQAGKYSINLSYTPSTPSLTSFNLKLCFNYG